jgi:comEA protein
VQAVATTITRSSANWTRGPARLAAAVVLIVAAGFGALTSSRMLQRDTGLSTATPRPIDLNTATAEEIELLPGIGPKRAADIIAEREANGPFLSVADLKRVKGIAARTSERLAPHATAGR